MNNNDGASPDFLASPNNRGRGVRRLNYVPIVIVALIIVLAVIAIAYTLYQRQASQQRLASSPLEPGAVINPPTPPIRPEKASVPQAPAEVPVEQPIVTPDKQAANNPKIDPELEARRRMIQRIEESKFSSFEAALGAAPNVASFSQHQRANNGNDISDGEPQEQPMTFSGSPQVYRTASTTGLNPASTTGLNLGDGSIGGGSVTEPIDPNQQNHKRAFLSQSPDLDTYLKHTRTAPLASMEVKAGTIIPGVMISGINSDLPGQIIGQVRENIYDTATGQTLLIPAGARLVGTYDSTITTGQRRVLIAWRRIIYPDGSSVSLDLMPGADTSGYAGFSDQVNNHYWRIFGNAFMLSLFSAGIQLSQPDNNNQFGGYDSQQILAAEIGRQLGQLGMEMARRNLDIQPTLEIRPGYRFVIMVTKDIVLPPWQGHPLAVNQH